MWTAKDDWIRAVATAAETNCPEWLAHGLLTVWDRLPPKPTQLRLQPRLEPWLGYLTSILFGNTPNLSAKPVAAWVWPFAWQLCEAQPLRRSNVLAAAAQQPSQVTPDFKAHLLNPVLARNDVEVSAPLHSATFRFALALRVGKSPSYPVLAGKDLEAAPLWLPMLKGIPKPKAAPLEKLEQFPLAVLYRDSMQQPFQFSRGFLSEWLRMISDPPRRDVCAWYVQQAKWENVAFWRFTAGWQKITELKPSEEARFLKEDLFGEYLAAVVQGAPLTSRLSRQIQEEDLHSACRTPEESVAVYERCLAIGDVMVATVFWHNCLTRMNAEQHQQLQHAITRGSLKKAVFRIFGTRETDDGWYRLALRIHQESGEKYRTPMLKMLQQILQPPEE